jgi:hypothetical protein
MSSVLNKKWTVEGQKSKYPIGGETVQLIFRDVELTEKVCKVMEKGIANQKYDDLSSANKQYVDGIDKLMSANGEWEVPKFVDRYRFMFACEEFPEWKNSFVDIEIPEGKNLMYASGRFAKWIYPITGRAIQPGEDVAITDFINIGDKFIGSVLNRNGWVSLDPKSIRKFEKVMIPESDVPIELMASLLIVRDAGNITKKQLQEYLTGVDYPKTFAEDYKRLVDEGFVEYVDGKIVLNIEFVE